MRIFSEPKSSRLVAALPDQVVMFAERGWRLFPVKPRDKTPLLKKWQELASTDLEVLTRWAGQNPGCNWGLATGRKSNLLVVDFDDEDALLAVKNLGHLPSTYTVKTAMGWHYYFLYVEGVRNSVKNRGLALDVRGEGGYVIVPPSIHPKGTAYTTHSSDPVAEAPKWLLTLLKNPSRAEGHTFVPSWGAEKREAIVEGERNTKLASLAGTLQRRGSSPEAIEAFLLAENKARVTPPLSEEDVIKIARSISRYEPTVEDEGVLIVGHKPIAELVTEGERILKAMPERLFCTPGNQLVRVIQYNQAPNDEDVRRDPEANVMVEVDALYLRDALSRSGLVRKYFKERLIWADPPRDLAELILSRVRKSPELVSWNRLRMLSRAPILLPDGTIDKDSGYNKASHVWIDTRGLHFEDLVAPTAKFTAERARRLLEEFLHPPFAGYRFALESPNQEWHSTPGFAVVLSAMLSIAVRNLLPTVPAHAFDAPEMGSGKTKLAFAVSAAMTGTKPSTVGYENASEFSKHLPPLLEKGDRVILVDNVNMTMNCSWFAMALTQEGPIGHRPLTTSTSKPVENQAVVLITGNNLTISGDLRRRTLLARIEPRDARPEYRRFDFDPVDRAMQAFPQMTMAALAVIRGHMLSGCPGLKLLTQTQAMDLGSFEAWNRYVRSALLWCGYADPVSTQQAIRDNDPALENDEELLSVIRSSLRDKPFLVCQLKNTLPDSALFRVKELTTHRAGEEFSESKVGYCLRRMRDRWVGDFRVVRTGKAVRGKAEWCIEVREGADDSEEAL